MIWEELQEFIKGKHLLIGLTFIGENGKVVEQYQTNGTVEALTDDRLFKILRNDGSVFQLPYDRETIRKAEKGEYRERTTGQIVTDPDFIVTWEIIIKKNDNLEEVKKYGYR